jgi:hypothetical protein
MENQGTEIERVEIRPHMRLGMILIGAGIVNALTGASALLMEAAGQGGAAAGWANKIVCAGFIAYGIWSARKKIIVDNGAALFVGLVSGRRSAEVLIRDIDSVAYGDSGKSVEIKAKAGTLRVGLRAGSKALGELFQALKARGVAVPETGKG